MELEKSSDVKSKRSSSNQTSHLFSYSEEAEHVLVRDTATAANYSGFGQARSAGASELKLSEESLPYLSSSLDADIEMYHEKRMRIGCAWADESKEAADMLERARDDTYCNCRRCDDCRQGGLGEDSELEYLSAHEEDFDDRNSSSGSSEQRETIGVKTTKLIDPVHEVPRGGAAQQQNLIDKSEDCSPASEYSVGGQTNPEAAMTELLHLLQDSLSLPDCSGMMHDPQEEQTEYHSVVCGGILGSDCWGNKERVCPNLLDYGSLESEETKEVPLTEGMLPPQTTTSEELSEKNDRDTHSISVKQDSPSLPPREMAPAVAMQCWARAGDSDFYSCEEPGVHIRGTSCIDCTARDAETQFPVSGILPSKNPSLGVEVAAKSSCGNPSCLNLEHRETLKNSAVNQAVDVCSDFRACFTTSRSTGAQVCLSSRAINTEITMMNKSRAMGWHRETYADVACNTDWSCGVGSAEKIWSQLTEMLQNHSHGNTATARSSQIQQESQNELRGSDLKISADSYVSGTREADFEALKLQERKISVSMDNPQTVCLMDGGQQSDSTSSKAFEEHHKDQDVEHGCVKNKEGNEDWFDAKQDLMVADFSVISEETKKQQKKQDMVDLKEAKIMKSRSEYCFVRVGGLSPSVSEDHLRSHFQKYQVSETLISMHTVDYINYRYAILAFEDANKAKLAVEEMNGKKIKGKSVSVELVNTSSDNKCLAFQVRKNKRWCEMQAVDNSQRNYQDETFTSAYNSVKAPDGTSASEKTHFLPITKSNISCCTQVPSETKCSGLKSSTEDTGCYLLGVKQKDTGENTLQKISIPFSTRSNDGLISPKKQNLSSFTKLMKKLQEIHPEASRVKIVDALVEMRKNNNCTLSGLPLSSIVEGTSVILRKRSPRCGWEKQYK